MTATMERSAETVAEPEPLAARSISEEQRAQLLRPINPRRVKDREGMAYLEAYDVRAMLIRIFDFGGWSAELLNLTLLYEQETQTRAGKAAYKVGYRATVRLSIHPTDDGYGASYTEAAVGESVMPDFKRGDCHDMAIKTAESQALKRCAVNLGDQFGISLYNGGSRAALIQRVIGTGTKPAETGLDEHITDLHPEEESTDREQLSPSEHLTAALDVINNAQSLEEAVQVWGDVWREHGPHLSLREKAQLHAAKEARKAQLETTVEPTVPMWGDPDYVEKDTS